MLSHLGRNGRTRDAAPPQPSDDELELDVEREEALGPRTGDLGD
jgi:hypothetical protein